MPDWAFSKTSRKQDSKKEEDINKRQSISIPDMARILEKFRRILQKRHMSVEFKPSKKTQIETGPPQGQNAKTQREQYHVCHTVPGGMHLTVHWAN